MTNQPIFTSSYAPSVQAQFKEILHGLNDTAPNTYELSDKDIERAYHVLENTLPSTTPSDKVERLLMLKEAYEHLCVLSIGRLSGCKTNEDYLDLLSQLQDTAIEVVDLTDEKEGLEKTIKDLGKSLGKLD